MNKQKQTAIKLSNTSGQGNPPTRCSTLPPAQTTTPRFKGLPKELFSAHLTPKKAILLADMCWWWLYKHTDTKEFGRAFFRPLKHASGIHKRSKQNVSTDIQYLVANGWLMCLGTLDIVDCIPKKWYKINHKTAVILDAFLAGELTLVSKGNKLNNYDPTMTPPLPDYDPIMTPSLPISNNLEQRTDIISPTEVVEVPPVIQHNLKGKKMVSPMSTPHGATWLQKLIYDWEAMQEEFHGTVTMQDRAVVMGAIKLIVGRLGFANQFTNSQEEHDKVVQIMHTYFQTNYGEYKAVFFYKQIKDGLLDIAQMAAISVVAPTGLAYELVDPTWELTQERKEILDTIQMNYKDKASVSVRMTALGVPQAKL